METCDEVYGGRYANFILQLSKLEFQPIDMFSILDCPYY
jgi:hypothetical protein